MDKLIEETAKHVFKIDNLRPFQKEIINEIISGFNSDNGSLIAILPTGGGKSLCFQLPAVLATGITIIIYPILALIRDQSNSLNKLNIKHVVLTSENDKKKALLDIMSGGKKIVITSMESLMNPVILSFLSTKKISLIVFDEAHTVISWGESFRPTYLSSKDVIKRLNPNQTLAFTATLDSYTEKRLSSLIFLTKPKIIQASMNRENIIYHRVRSLFPLMDIVMLLSDKSKRPAIIFTSSRKRTEELALKLSKYFNTMYYHAGLSSASRLEIEKDFFNSKDSVMVATVAYGMGVNKKDIKSVIHYDISKTASDYLQESGRAGRDGSIAHAYVLIKPDEDSPLKEVFSSNGCIREKLISLMGKELLDECQGCDGCMNIYTPCWGEKEILKYVKLFRFLFTKITLLKFFKRKKIFNNIEERELRRAIDILLKEKKIKSFFSHIF